MRYSSHLEKRGRIKLRWFALVGLAVLALLANEVIGQDGYVARRQQLQRIQALNGQINQLKQENERLSGRIEGLRSDPGAIEVVAREQLHLGRPGEVVVTLSPTSSGTPPVSATPPAYSQPVPNHSPR